MKEFACGAVVPGCDARFVAESEDDLFEQIGAHARAAHGMDSVAPEILEQVRANIHDVPA